jgi:hypothetical protein
MSAISDIRHRHLLFRYRKNICRTENRHSDVGRVPISTLELIPISDIKRKYHIISAGFELKSHAFTGERITPQLLCGSVNCVMLDIRYRIKVYSDIRYNVGFRSLQSDIGRFDIQLSPISLITDIGPTYGIQWQSKGEQMHQRGLLDASMV